MYAIVEIQGQQFKAEAGKFLYVHYLGDEKKEGETLEFDRVLLVDADGAVKVGAPTVEGAKSCLRGETSPRERRQSHRFQEKNVATTMFARTDIARCSPRL